jgi:D-serine deaminase-like pyridoxal phosphate-dependent protein
MVRTAELLRSNGFDIREVSVGSSPTAPYAAEVEGVTEVRPGNYVLNDCMAMDLGYSTEGDCAATVLVTVVSHPAPDRCIFDGGSKTFTSDGPAAFGVSGHGKTTGRGLVKGRPDLLLYSFNEEHGFVRLTEPSQKVAIGDRYQVIPVHACGMMNMHDSAIGIRNGHVERTILIAARGKVR